MKDLLFLNDLFTLLQRDGDYSEFKKLSLALRKFGLDSVERSNSLEKMHRALAVYIMDQRGESEPFLTEAFIEPAAAAALFKENGLTIPAALRPKSATAADKPDFSDPAVFELLLDKVCRNCGTVNDPLGLSYRSPIGRLIFRTYLETWLETGLNTTARYVLDHLKNFDKDKVVTAVEEDYVTWKTDDGKEKITSLYTIDKFVIKFNHELKALL